MPIAWWILNYTKYDPGLGSKGLASTFRNGILNVVETEVGNFLKAIESDKITAADFKIAVEVPVEYKKLSFFVDFDSKLFVNGFYENVEPEAYMPDDDWQGEMGYPIDYLPKELRSEFEDLS